MIINAYKRKVEANSEITIRKVRTILSKELGIGETTIFNTIKEYRESRTVSSPNRERRYTNVTSKTDEFDKHAIRRKIHGIWINREVPTLNKILSVINKDESLPSFSRSTLHRLLKSMDFQYTKRGQNSALLESNDLILWRRKYLRNIQTYREEGRPIYFLDGTIQSNHDGVSQKLTTGVVNSCVEEKRLIVIHIGSEDGFVPGALLSFETKKNINNYHDEMNGDSFRDWLLTVLPILKDNAVMVMNDVSYHSVRLEECPTTNWKKADIIEWLVSKGEVIDKTMIVPELMEVVERLKLLYKYEIDKLVLEHNKTVLRLPPYHCELNPMEMAWSAVKTHVKSNNMTFKLSDVKNLLIEGTNKVTKNMWKNFIISTKKEEEKFWNLDMIMDELMDERQPVVRTIGSSDDDDSFFDSD